MNQRLQRKDFLDDKEMDQAHVQWLLDFGWPVEYHWNNEPHASCKHVPGGKWKLQSFGYYLASDWKHRLYTSHRCSRCGMLVQHNQLCSDDGKPEGLITRLVIVP